MSLIEYVLDPTYKEGFKVGRPLAGTYIPRPGVKGPHEGAVRSVQSIADELGVSHQAVSEMLRKALRKLKEGLAEKGYVRYTSGDSPVYEHSLSLTHTGRDLNAQGFDFFRM